MIGIDEAQFFEDLYDFCREAADHDGKTVIVAGLDGDYLRYIILISFHCWSNLKVLLGFCLWEISFAEGALVLCWI